MARRLLDLRGVPDDEHAALRRVLDDAGVDYYELPPSAFGISAGSLWIRDDSEFDKARTVFERFQADWADRARREAPVEPLGLQIRRRPLRIVGYALAALFIVLLMAWPIVELWADFKAG
jgi:hypothetical protein